MRKIIFGMFLILSLPLSIHSQTYWNLEPIWEKTEPESSFSWGVHLSSGDINNDGFSDFGITEISKLPTIYTMKVHLFKGGTLDTLPYLILSGEKPDDNFGFNFDFIDFNGDSYDDVVVGAGNYSIGGYCWGRAYVYFGGESMDSIPDWKKTGSYESVFGNKITVGDFNNDGYGDIAVANPTVNVDGMVYIFYGYINPDTIPDVILVGEDSGPVNSLFGCKISGGFDINGDEYDDLIVGSEGYNVMNGRMYVFFGGNPMDTIPDLEFGGPGGYFGEELGMLGDIDGDNYGDFAVGRSIFDKILVYKGGTSLDSLYDYVFADVDTSTGNLFGASFDGVGPLFPGDQNRQLLVGAFNFGYYNMGKVYLFQCGSLLDTICDASATGYFYMDLGYRVADAGDVDGDGANEIIFSCLGYDTIPSKVWICKYVGPGVEEVKWQTEYERKIRLFPPYPNPFTSEVMVMWSGISDKQKVTLKIYDISGRLVKSVPLTTNHLSLGTDLNPGIYFLKVDGKYIEKVVKVR